MGFEQRMEFNKPEVIVDTDAPKLKRELEEIEKKIRESKDNPNAAELKKELEKQKDEIIGNFFKPPQE